MNDSRGHTLTRPVIQEGRVTTILTEKGERERA